MKTNLVAAAALMTLIAAAAPARVSDEVRPPGSLGAVTPLPARIGALNLVRVESMPVTWLSPVECRVGAAVSVATYTRDPHYAQIYVDGDLVAQGFVRPGTSQRITADVKSDGRAHELRVRVYRDLLDGPRVLAKDQAFPIWLPAQ